MTLFSAAFTSNRFYFLADVTDTSLTCYHCANDDVMSVLNGATRDVEWQTINVSYYSGLNMEHSYTAEIASIHHQID